MKINIKKLDQRAVIPKYAKAGDAGMDLTAISVRYDPKFDGIVYDTGLAIEIPEGYVGLLFPRSSNCKKDLILSNHVGVIDSGYRGSISFVYKTNFDYWDVSVADTFQDKLQEGVFLYYNSAEDEYMKLDRPGQVYAVGDRVGQIVILPYPTIEFEEVEDLTETERGQSGYGSSGK